MIQKYDRDDLERFLVAIDAGLSEPYTLIVIGGAAAALAYGVSTFTRDIDSATSTAPIMKAYEAAKLSTGLDIPLQQVGVFDPPCEYETRLAPYVLSGASKLSILVPERHDLVLMKAVRGDEHDLEAADEIHRREPLVLDVLLERIQMEMREVIGDQRRVRGNFLALIERLFGEEAALKAEKALKGWGESRRP